MLIFSQEMVVGSALIHGYYLPICITLEWAEQQMAFCVLAG
jgi:hypothetical protein